MVRSLFALLLLSSAGIASAEVQAPLVERTAPGRITVTWTDAAPVDVFLATTPDATPEEAKLVSDDDRDGREELAVPSGARPYVILRDEKDGTVVRVAERLLPLERGSNWRDVGGYPAAGGKHVKWGLIYRSGATPLITDHDVAYIEGLGVKSMIDLRSSEERKIAPTRLSDDGKIRYIAYDYSMASTFAPTAPVGANPANMMNRATAMYREWPTSLAPQYRAIFQQLLAGSGPIEYNCSAGQDRTGVATALVLTALGVPRPVVLEDYHLSTKYRQIDNEMPPISEAEAKENAVAAFFAKAQATPGARTPKPLVTPDGQPYLAAAFDEIETRWGSVDAYLDKELGVGPVQIAQLRRMYLE